MGIKYYSKSLRKLNGTALPNKSSLIAGNKPATGKANGAIGMKPATNGNAKGAKGNNENGIADTGT